jgi:hypothetical protein
VAGNGGLSFDTPTGLAECFKWDNSRSSGGNSGDRPPASHRFPAFIAAGQSISLIFLDTVLRLMDIIVTEPDINGGTFFQKGCKLGKGFPQPWEKTAAGLSVAHLA